jgi:hypothetical protein
MYLPKLERLIPTKTKRKKTTGPFKVHMIESEIGWGRKLDRVLSFPTEAKAKAYVKKYNDKYNNEPVVPSWYIIAHYAGYKGELA